MKKLFTFTLCLLLKIAADAQVTLHHVEDFEVGDSMVFSVPDVETVSVGPAGAGRVWDFSDLQIGTQRKKQQILRKNWSKFGSQIPKADVVERTSNGTYVFMTKSGDTNHVTGFVDSSQNLVIKYSKPYSFIKRPFTYRDSLYEDYARSYTINGMDIEGTGNSKTVADGYGTLILPSKTYNDVIRIKFEQFSYDAIAAGDTQFVYAVSYAWFDAHHKSALLKIDSVSIVSRFFSNQFREGILLNEEFSIGIKSEKYIVTPDFDLFYSADNKLWIKTNKADNYNVEIFSMTGQLLHKSRLYTGADQKKVIPMPDNYLKNRFLIVRVSNSTTSQSIKIFQQ